LRLFEKIKSKRITTHSNVKINRREVEQVKINVPGFGIKGDQAATELIRRTLVNNFMVVNTIVV